MDIIDNIFTVNRDCIFTINRHADNEVSIVSMSSMKTSYFYKEGVDSWKQVFLGNGEEANNLLVEIAEEFANSGYKYIFNDIQMGRLNACKLDGTRECYRYW